MQTNSTSYRGYRFPREVISHGVWLYHRFSLSFRDVEELLAKRGILVSYETTRQWCRKFGPEYARRLKQHQGRLGDIWHLDEVFVRIRGERHYLWRAVDQDGEVIDILVQRYRNARAANRIRIVSTLYARQAEEARVMRVWKRSVERSRFGGGVVKGMEPGEGSREFVVAEGLEWAGLRPASECRSFEIPKPPFAAPDGIAIADRWTWHFVRRRSPG